MLTGPAIAVAAAPLLGPGDAAWLVGGTVRDELLHTGGGDIDIAFSGDGEAFARALAGAIGGTFFTYSERFSAWRIACDEGRVDVAPLKGATIEEDLAARDFTIDAMARPLGGGPLVDPLGGRADLEAGALRLCAPAAFTDDPVRVLRLARLAETLGLAPAADVEAAARAAAGGLASASGERVEHELSALLAGPAAARALRRLDDNGALDVVLPEFGALRDVSQNPYHHLDVFDHTLEALEFLPAVVAMLGGERFVAPPEAAGLAGADRLAPLAWATLLHDIGKPAARRVDEQGRVTFFHHDEIGARMAAGVARRLRCSRRFQEYLVNLIRWHLRLGFLVREMPLTRRALVRFRRASEPFVFEAIVLSVSDRIATRGDRTPPESLARHFRIARDVFGDAPAGPPRRLLTGVEVMEHLGLPPGPDVGLALDLLQEEIDCGEVTTPDQARAFLSGWWARESAGRTGRPGGEAGAGSEAGAGGEEGAGGAGAGE
jgi:poly(A) polymerase